MVNKEAEEEQYRDLTLLMELLTNLLSKDFIDLRTLARNQTRYIDDTATYILEFILYWQCIKSHSRYRIYQIKL